MLNLAHIHRFASSPMFQHIDKIRKRYAVVLLEKMG